MSTYKIDLKCPDLGRKLKNIFIFLFTDSYSSRKTQEPVVLPTAPRAARGPGADEENIPTNPPFVAYISNLSYDVVEEDLAEFFADMQVSVVTIE